MSFEPLVFCFKWEPQSLGLPPNLWLCSNFRRVLVVYYNPRLLLAKLEIVVASLNKTSTCPQAFLLSKGRNNWKIWRLKKPKRLKIRILLDNTSWRDAMSWMANPVDRWKDQRHHRKLAKISTEGKIQIWKFKNQFERFIHRWDTVSKWKYFYDLFKKIPMTL